MAKDKSYRSGYKTTRADHPAENAAAQAAAMAMEASASIKAMIEKQQGPIPKLPPVYLDDAIRSRLLQWNIPQLIAMGASTGGTEALATVLTALRPPMPPIVVVQHIPPYFSRLFAQRLDADCELQISEAKEGDIPAAVGAFLFRLAVVSLDGSGGASALLKLIFGFQKIYQGHKLTCFP